MEDDTKQKRFRTRTKYTLKMLTKDLFMIIDRFKDLGDASGYTAKDFLQAVDMLAKYSKVEWGQKKTNDGETVFFDFTLDKNGVKNGGVVEIDGTIFKLVKNN